MYKKYQPGNEATFAEQSEVTTKVSFRQRGVRANCSLEVIVRLSLLQCILVVLFNFQAVILNINCSLSVIIFNYYVCFFVPMVRTKYVEPAT